MSKAAKVNIWSIIFLLSAIIFWLGHSYLNAEPVDSAAMDGGKSGRNYMEYQRETQREACEEQMKNWSPGELVPKCSKEWLNEQNKNGNLRKEGTKLPMPLENSKTE